MRSQVIRAVDPDHFPINVVVATMNRLFQENPAAFVDLMDWLGSTDYGEVTVRFQAGKFSLVEQARRSK